MKIAWNKRTNLPTIEFEDADFLNANHVRQLVNGKFVCQGCGSENESYAWKVLSGYFASMRIAIEERGKIHARTRAQKDLCSNDFSVLDGFDVAVGIPSKIVLQADMMAEQQNHIKEEVNATDDE